MSVGGGDDAVEDHQLHLLLMGCCGPTKVGYRYQTLSLRLESWMMTGGSADDDVVDGGGDNSVQSKDEDGDDDDETPGDRDLKCTHEIQMVEYLVGLDMPVVYGPEEEFGSMWGERKTGGYHFLD